MSWKTFKPIGAKVLVRLHGRRDRIGSIVIPDDFQRQPESAEVIAVGPDAPRELEPGMTVLIGKYNGKPIPPRAGDEHSEYYVMDCDYALPAPHCPDIYAQIDANAGDDVTLMVSSDVPTKRV